MKMINSLSDTAKSMLKWMLILFAVLGIAGSAVVFMIGKGYLFFPYWLGLLLGSLLSALKLVLIEKSLNQTADMNGGKASGYASLQYILRYVLTVAFLITAFLLPQYVNLFGVIAGILTLQFSAYGANFENKRKLK